jgi:hypothetical protein
LNSQLLESIYRRRWLMNYGRYFFQSADETTDLSTQKKLTILVQFYDFFRAFCRYSGFDRICRRNQQINFQCSTVFSLKNMKKVIWFSADT